MTPFLIARMRALADLTRERLALLRGSIFDETMFSEADWTTAVALHDEHGILTGPMPHPVSGVVLADLYVPLVLTYALGAQMRDGHAFVSLGVAPMDESAPLKPTRAEQVEKANAVYEQGLNDGAYRERSRIAEAHRRCFAGLAKSDEIKAALIRFNTFVDQSVGAGRWR